MELAGTGSDLETTWTHLFLLFVPLSSAADSKCAIPNPYRLFHLQFITARSIVTVSPFCERDDVQKAKE